MLAEVTRRIAALAVVALLAACATPVAGPPEPQRFSGVYFQNFEITAFRADGQDEAWWVRATPEAWEKLFADAPEGFAPPPEGMQIRADVVGQLTEPGRYGHLGSFRRGLYIIDVIEAHIEPVFCAPEAAIVYFDVNQAQLSAAAAAQIEAMIRSQRTRACSVSRIRITGFTDTTGSAAYNQALSERRANAVRDAIAARGFADAVFDVEGLGERAPQRPTADGVAEPLNRGVRIEIESGAPERGAAAAPAQRAAAQTAPPPVAAPGEAYPLRRVAFSPPSRREQDKRPIATPADPAWRR